jgi:hypothetical protein
VGEYRGPFAHVFRLLMSCAAACLSTCSGSPRTSVVASIRHTSPERQLRLLSVRAATTTSQRVVTRFDSSTC